MKPLKIALLMIEPPLPFGNAAARWFYVLLRELVARGHHVTAFAACANPKDIEKTKALFPSPQYDLRLYPYPERRGLLRKFETFQRPYSHMFSAEIIRDFAAACATADVVHMEQLWCAWLVGPYAAKTLVNVHHLQAIDLEEIKPANLKQRLEHWMIESTEKRLCQKVQHIRSCSPRLIPRLKEFNPNLSITVVPVGLEPAQYDYIPDDRRTREPVVSVIGTMSWYPTSSAARRLMQRLWPTIKARVPNAKAQLVGWGAKSALAEFAHLPDVDIAENVPDIRPYFEKTGVMLYAPSRGSGMKIKILESLGFGVPVVTTSEGVEGLPAEDGVHAGVCEDDAGLIERAVTLLNDSAAQNRQRAAGRQLLESHCGPKPTVDAIEAIYTQMLKG